MVEAILPKSFKQIHELISKILKDNSDPNDKEAESKREKKKLDAFTKVLHTVQTNLLTSNKSQQEIRSMILGMKQDIATMIDDHSSEELEQILTQFADMSETIHSNFSQINSRLNDLENNVIAAIREEKNLEISSLKE